MASTFIACAGSELFEFDESAAGSRNPVPRWHWDAHATAGAGDTFESLDECKPVNGARQVLVTSSWKGGVALVDHGSGALLFTSVSANAHSAALLPGGRVALASSEGTDLISLYAHYLGRHPVWTVPLKHAHGAVWDEKRKLLWTLGYEELRSYRVPGPETANPTPALVSSVRLPDDNGHDLAEIPGSADLAVTTAGGVYLFDRDAGVFNPHPALGSAPHVKSISIHPVTGRTLYVQADTPEWWSETVRFLDPVETFVMPGKHLYKARWMPVVE